MTKYDADTAITALELQNLVTEYCFELDSTGGLNSARFFTEDGFIDVGAMSIKGHADITKFYKDFVENVQKEGGTRTTRHVWTNFRLLSDGQNSATVECIMMNFSGAGEPPLVGATVPTVLSDVRLKCRREGDGEWRIAEFTGGPIFVGDDPIQNKVLVDDN